MSYQSPYQTFVFEKYSFDAGSGEAVFEYSFDSELYFSEKVKFSGYKQTEYDAGALQRALELSFYLAGVSYYKCYPTRQASFKVASPDEQQAKFLTTVYREGLSQFMFENGLDLSDMVQFMGNESATESVNYNGKGLVVLQSGGKDSLLLAELLLAQKQQFMPFYVSSSHGYPEVLDKIEFEINTVDRQIDITALRQAGASGALNGHVPVTYIVCSYALISAILHGKNTVLTAIGHEGEEPHEYIGDMPVNHQWSKTWLAEQLLSEYINENISPDIKVGSPLRGFSELKIAELFVEKCWAKYGHSFSSCNRANYQQGANNTRLKWCGDCPKCANSYLLFAPFVEPTELQSLFAGQDLFQKPSLLETFKGLLGIDGVMKPFECVGETDELRLAYHMAREKYGEQAYELPFTVPKSNFDYQKIYEGSTDLTELAL